MTAGAASGSTWSGTVRVVQGDNVIEDYSVGSGPGTSDLSTSSALRFQTGSISKLVLSVVVLMLVEQRHLRLDRPINRWLNGGPRAWDGVTLHRLLSHTAGLGHWADIPGLDLSDLPDQDALIRLITDAPLVHPPGRRWRYSGPGFVLAGLVVQAVTGRPYGRVAADMVFGPAGMTSTTSGIYPVGERDVAVGHHRGQAILVQPEFTHIFGTGDLWSTARDLIGFSQTLRSGGLLSPEAASQVFTAHTGLTPPVSSGPTIATAYGYGVFLGQVLGCRAWFSPGDNPGYQSVLAYLPDSDIDLAVLGNEDEPGVAAPLERLTLV